MIRRKSHLKILDAIIVSAILFLNGILITNDQQLLKIKWLGLVIRSSLDLNTTITTNNNNSGNNNNCKTNNNNKA
jgi:hypothetical protein